MDQGWVCKMCKAGREGGQRNMENDKISYNSFIQAFSPASIETLPWRRLPQRLLWLAFIIKKRLIGKPTGSCKNDCNSSERTSSIDYSSCFPFLISVWVLCMHTNTHLHPHRYCNSPAKPHTGLRGKTKLKHLSKLIILYLSPNPFPYLSVNS